MTTDLILGTAGHIDHGKTALIGALTGVDTDRLPEEKKRGITIDLGFAELCVGAYRMGIVDVPGHERFVRNMLAGATGMDLAMLVVAADDSIKPQTREHLDILRLLNLKAGVIAITKCDLVDPEWISLVEEEIHELVVGTFLADAPIISTSAVTQQGIDALRQALVAAAAKTPATCPSLDGSKGPFRLAIDRTFTIPGHGTVVTGSVSSGTARVGDELVIEPGDIKVRVRGLQNHDRTTDEVHRGQRAAINLVGVHHQQTQRGHELATRGHLRPSRLLTVRLQAVASAPRPLKHRARVRVHIGTAQLLAVVSLLDCDQLAPGEVAMAQLFMNGEAVTTWNQPFVIRSESPVQTIGGGQILVPSGRKIRRHNPVALRFLTQLTSDDATQRGSAALYFAGFDQWEPGDLSRTAGVQSVEAVYAQLKQEQILIEVPISPTRTLKLHRDVLEELYDRIDKTLAAMHQRYPLRSSIDRSVIRQAFSYLASALLNHALSVMRQQGRIRLSERGVTLVGCGPKLTQNERKLMTQLIDTYRAAGIQSPSVKQIQQETTKNQSSVPQLLALAAADGELVEVAPGFYLHTDVDQRLRERLLQSFGAEQGVTLSQIREVLGTTRKYAVPYCEYLDHSGFTRRDGDLRFLARAGQEHGD